MLIMKFLILNFCSRHHTLRSFLLRIIYLTYFFQQMHAYDNSLASSLITSSCLVHSSFCLVLLVFHSSHGLATGTQICLVLAIESSMLAVESLALVVNKL